MNYNLKLFIKVFLKCLCLSVLFYGAIEVTKEYFSYPYVYRLNVKPNERLYIPPITICTERDMLFDKTRIIDYFNISTKYEKHNKFSIYHSKSLESSCQN